MDVLHLAPRAPRLAGVTMRIGFFGNINNYPFMLARELRAMGHDVVAFVDHHYLLHRPESRYDDITVPYPDWIHDVSHFGLLQHLVPTPKRARVVGILRSCDAVILNDIGPSLADAVGKPAVVMLTGSDLESLAHDLHRRLLLPPGRFRAVRAAIAPIVLRPLLARFVQRQRSGIRHAVAVNYFPPGAVPHGDAILDSIGVTREQRIFYMLTDVDRFSFTPPPSNERLRIYCGTRHVWKRPMPPGFSEIDYKGSDIMIRGLAAFRRASGRPLDIRFVRKGMNVDDSIALIEAEGLTADVTWLPEMSQNGVRDELRAADVVMEQFGTTRLYGMMSLDAMATGRPVIANIDSSLFEPFVGEPSPVCRATTPEEVAEQLRRLADPAAREKIGLASRSHVERFYSPRHAAELCLDRLRTKVAAARPTA